MLLGFAWFGFRCFSWFLGMFGWFSYALGSWICLCI